MEPYGNGTETVKAPRDRRARRAAETRTRIVEAAAKLFVERGYGATTIEAVAAEADVAVETVYSRFKNKRALLQAYLDTTIVGDAEPVPLLERPEAKAIADATDQREQVRLVAGIARGILERNAPAHAVIRSAIAVSPELEVLAEEDEARRKATQRAFVEMLSKRGPLRDGMSVADAVETAAALGNPENYAYLTRRRGWTPVRFQRWFEESLTLLLLPPS